MEDSSSPACAFHNVEEGGIEQLEDSSSPSSVFYNVGEGGIKQLHVHSTMLERVVLGS